MKWEFEACKYADKTGIDPNCTILTKAFCIEECKKCAFFITEAQYREKQEMLKKRKMEKYGLNDSED